METIAVAGAELQSLALGQGAPLLMLHGLANGNMASWYSAIASPLSASRQVLLYDQRGHGGSSLAASGYDLDQQADDLQAVLDHYHCGEGAVDLVGHSMGALIALHYALRQPGRVRRLVLVDAPMPARDYVAPSLFNATSREALAEWVLGELASAAGLSGRRRERLLQRLGALLFDTTLRQDVLAMDAEPEAALAALELPVLLVYGLRSPCLAAGERLASLLPQAQLKLLACGHYIPEEAPAELLVLLENFLNPNPHSMRLPAETTTVPPVTGVLP